MNKKRFPGSLVLLLSCLLPVCGQQEGKPDPPLPDPLVNFDPSTFVRFQSAHGAEARRLRLIEYLWQAKSLPATQPDSRPLTRDVFGGPLSGIDPLHSRTVRELICKMSPFDFTATCYLVESNQFNRNNRRLVIVHSGHRQGKEIAEGVDATVEKMLSLGFQVLVVDMPLVGWNRDRTFRVPGSDNRPKTITLSQRGTGGHNEMFRQLASPRLPDGTVFRFFVEPVIQGINYFQQSTPQAIDVSMVGLSGGGWATHFCAAIDRRIRYSFPVAGALPLYARKFSPGSWGDREQFYAPLYGEQDTNGDGVADRASGVASWLEIFVLGSIGNGSLRKTGAVGRYQLQILNFSDPCCFSTGIYRTYDRWVAGTSRRLGGRWSLFSDRSHQQHIISTAAIGKITSTLMEKKP